MAPEVNLNCLSNKQLIKITNELDEGGTDYRLCQEASALLLERTLAREGKKGVQESIDTSDWTVNISEEVMRKLNL